MSKYSASSLIRMIMFLASVAVYLGYVAYNEEKTIGKNIFFFDVGQGDATLVSDGSGSIFLTDAGPDTRIAKTIEDAIPFGRGYIDVVVVTHPQQDHFYGISALLDQYDIGVFVYNGQDAPENTAWHGLMEKLKIKKVAIVTVKKGDVIRHGKFLTSTIIHPTTDVLGSAELNDTSVVQKIMIGEFSLLITGDIDEKIEKQIIKRGVSSVDFLKVAHHGSSFSTSQDFLNIVKPKVAVIEYGLHNTYGHPSPVVEDRIKKKGIQLFETGRDGTVKIELRHPLFHIFSMK